MDAKPATVGPAASILEAASCLVRTEIGCVPVVDDRGELLGIVTEADLIRLQVAAAEGLRS
jgi:CBS domain-containing protein